MRLATTIMEDRLYWYERLLQLAGCALFATVLLCGCSSTPEDIDLLSEQVYQKTFFLKEITADQAKTFLSDLGLGTVYCSQEPNALILSGPPDELWNAGTILELIDANEQYVIKTLAPASMARSLPSNDQIAEAVDGITIGTFASPPRPGTNARAIIDLHGDAVLAIVPERFWPDICAIVESGAETVSYKKGTNSQKSQTDSKPVQTAADERSVDISDKHDKPAALSVASDKKLTKQVPDQLTTRLTKLGRSDPKPDAQSESQSDPAVHHEKVSLQEPKTIDREVSGPRPTIDFRSQDDPKISRGILKPSRMVSKLPEASGASPVISFANGNDILELSLPEKIGLVQLLDLVSEYLHLDCIYDTEKIGDHAITLKLHSRLRSELRVKDLYSLLETVLKFKGFVMTRQEGNLVTIVPAAEALAVDPKLVDPNTRTLQAGDMVVTRVFELQYVDVASVTNLLQNMKLSVAVSPIEKTQTLFVTCYAYRMGRIEQLVSMVDRLGRPREFRFRQLKYTMAGTITRKVLTLARELQSIPIIIASAGGGPSKTASRASTASLSRSSDTPLLARQAVYLDTDERTNRILMIGYDEQLATVEGLIDSLDVPKEDLRTPKTYDIKHMAAQQALQKLQELEVLDQSAVSISNPGKGASGISSAKAGAMQDSVLAEEPIVVVLEATNQLLVKATQEQHARLSEYLGHIDVSPEDLRTLQIYKINYVEAEEVTNKLGEFGIIGAGPETSLRITGPNKTKKPTTSSSSATAEALVQEPQVVVVEPTNSLMVNATAEQHAQLATIISHLDSKTEEIPYQFYPLQNQSPVHLAEVLQNLIHETIQDEEGKTEKVVKREEEIKIVPDPNTFSLIVYASKKNQEWIADLIEQLDKRRPQVLIDVTLVEVSRTDEFDLDLQLATKWPKLQTGAKMDVVGSIVSPFVSGTGEVLSSPKTGTAQGFYTDAHIQALLMAIQSKSYGRVLAKPKILVNDGQAGTIKTTDTTNVKIEQVIIPEEGIQRTTTDFRPYEAGIILTITPNISEGDLLLLKVELDRTDFQPRPEAELPPDTTASNINTIVTVPDGRTIILGGLLKLNQTKGGTKVPLLGDVPLLGGLFRSTSNTDSDTRLYVFLKANILRPDETAMGLPELEKISEKNRAAFEEFEEKFQKYEDWPGIKSQPMEPSKVLEAE